VQRGVDYLQSLCSTVGIAMKKKSTTKMRAQTFIAFIGVLMLQCAKTGAETQILAGTDEFTFGLHEGVGDSAWFALCVKGVPTQDFRRSLRMCRELNYPFCVNSTIVTSLLQHDTRAISRFFSAVHAPSLENIEIVSNALDLSLVKHYQTYTNAGDTSTACAHEWRMWVCSRTFNRRDEKTTLSAFPVCATNCERVASTCKADVDCANDAWHGTIGGCTDFENDAKHSCDRNDNRFGSSSSHVVPVFAHNADSSVFSGAQRRFLIPSNGDTATMFYFFAVSCVAILLYFAHA
jgi:hypothetical protein